MRQSSDFQNAAERETSATHHESVRLSSAQSRFYHRRAKRHARVSRRSIDLACEEFFRSRGISTALPFCRVTKRASQEQKDE
jgi:hypothetical protein